ncbi:hypothetical protein [uncultured Flavobacterium sp.]|uniref:hypothetical protein n=1 Tax=uncultured Flavobacterium sp. TaxID=165435 RepID=UPI0027E15BC0|nr:hypothetical protein [uncultured Flavobacterium sp.]
MPYELDRDIDLTPQTTAKYYVSSAHRRIQRHKSRWTVTIDKEVECFIDSQTKSWIDATASWGIIQEGNNLLVLGLNSQNEELKIAKFIAKNNDGVWHGYPADFNRKIQDRPAMSILQSWRTHGHIEKHHITKIRQGKECNL